MEAQDVTDIKKNSNNKEYVINAVKQKGKLLEFATTELQDDEDVVKVALEQDGEAMEFVSNRLKDDKDIALLAINKEPWTA